MTDFAPLDLLCTGVHTPNMSNATATDWDHLVTTLLGPEFKLGPTRRRSAAPYALTYRRPGTLSIETLGEGRDRASALAAGCRTLGLVNVGRSRRHWPMSCGGL